MNTSEWIIALGTAFLVVFSWKFSIQAKRYHGIARFFAFESLLFLIVLTADVWFKDPWSPWQVFSWLFLILSLYLAIHGMVLLVRMGKPQGDLENTTRLVTTGLYGLIRHPFYASLICLGMGAFLKQINPFTTTLVIINNIALLITAMVEEVEMMIKFGDEYRKYMKVTKMFIPFIY